MTKIQEWYARNWRAVDMAPVIAMLALCIVLIVRAIILLILEQDVIPNADGGQVG